MKKLLPIFYQKNFCKVFLSWFFFAAQTFSIPQNFAILIVLVQKFFSLIFPPLHGEPYISQKWKDGVVRNWPYEQKQTGDRKLEKPVVCFGVQSLIPGFVPRSTGEIGHEGRSHLSASAKCVAWSGDQGKIGQKLWTVHWSKETETGSAFTTGFGLLG